MDLNERKLQILQAIISDFIRSAEPVGSRTLSKKYDMGISPATIRNEMSDLEEMGFLTHPHTSAGRVPSDKAYRLYVNNFMKKYEIPEEKKRYIEEKMVSGVAELDKTIEHAAHLLSELTKLAAFAITPKQEENRIASIALSPVDENSVLLMIVTEDNRVSNRLIRIAEGYGEDGLGILAKNLSYTYRGKTLSEALETDIINSFRNDMAAMNRLAGSIMPNFMKTLESMLDVNLYTDGYMNIFSLPEYSDIERAKAFMQLLDRKEELRNVLVNRDNGVIITIGEENDEDRMRDYSIISATYRIDGKLVGKIGVIGPTRMKYDEVTSIIEYMTDNLSSSFKLTGGNEDD